MKKIKEDTTSILTLYMGEFFKNATTQEDHEERRLFAFIKFEKIKSGVLTHHKIKDKQWTGKIICSTYDKTTINPQTQNLPNYQ